MTEPKTPHEAPAVQLDDAALDGVQGGAQFAAADQGQQEIELMTKGRKQMLQWYKDMQ